MFHILYFIFFFFNDTATTEIYTLSLHDALPIFDSPTPRQGARRVWTDSHGLIWVSEWNAGQVGRYDPRSGEWQEWELRGNRPKTNAGYVDEHDSVWVRDLGSNALVQFEPYTESLTQFELQLSGTGI